MEGRVCARFEISSSNPGLMQVCIFHQTELYFYSIGACGDNRLAGIFFLFYFSILEFFLIF